MNTTQRGVTLAEDAAVAPAISDSDNQLRLRRGIVGSLQRNLHIAGNRPGDQQHVCEPRRCRKMDAETLAIVNRIINRMYLKFTSIARTGIYLADGETALEAPPYDLLEPYGDFFELRVGNRRKRLGDDTGMKYLFEV